MKTLTRDDVKKVATALIIINAETTTLEVKRTLRKNGFWATQDQVREFMLDITSKDGELVYDEHITEGFRIYSFRENDTTSMVKAGLESFQDMLTRASQVGALGTTVGRKRHNTDTLIRNYRVTDAQGGNYRFYANVNRTQAKNLWAKEVGRSYLDARTTIHS